MKPILRSLLTLGLLTVAALPAHAVTPFTESFTAVTLNPTRWSLTKEGGLLKPSNGKLLYSVTTVGSENSSHILLRGIQPKYNESWEVTVDAVNSTQTDSWTWIGVAVLNAADLDDFVGLEVSSGPDQTEILSDFGTNGVEAADVVRSISSSQASLRVTFSHLTKILTLWYSTGPTGAWIKHATFSTTNSTSAKRRGNWRMSNTTGKFTLALYGGGDGDKVPAGQMTLDRFVVRNLK